MAHSSEAYAVIPMPAELRGTSDYWTGWWTVTRNGVPVRHYPPKDRDLAERFATESCLSAAAHEQKGRRMSADKKGVHDLDFPAASPDAEHKRDRHKQDHQPDQRGPYSPLSFFSM
jgi:hypothetical protein